MSKRMWYHKARLVVRATRLLWQRITRGWSDKETWALDGYIARFAVPRLKRFRELTITHPQKFSDEEWDALLGDMIYALEVSIIELDDVVGPNGADWDRVERGLRAFGEEFRNLWW